MDYVKIIFNQFANGVAFNNLLPANEETNEHHNLLEVVKSKASGKATLGRCMRICGNIIGVLTVIPFVVFFIRLIFKAVREDIALSKSVDVPSTIDEQPPSSPASQVMASTPAAMPVVTQAEDFGELWEKAAAEDKFEYCDVKILLMNSQDSIPPVKSDIYFIGNQSFDDFCPASDRETILDAKVRWNAWDESEGPKIPLPVDEYIDEVAVKEDSKLFQKYEARCLACFRPLKKAEAAKKRCEGFYSHALDAIYYRLWCRSLDNPTAGKAMSDKSVVFSNIGGDTFGLTSEQEAATIAVAKIALHCHGEKEHALRHCGETRGAASIVIVQKDREALECYRNQWQIVMKEQEKEEKAKAHSAVSSDSD